MRIENMFSWKKNIIALVLTLKMMSLALGQTAPPPQQNTTTTTTSAVTQATPTGIAKGVNPLGSYGGSNFDKINLFNGNVSMSFPLASLTSRGGMSVGVVLSYNSKLWYVEKQETEVTARIINEPPTSSIAYVPMYDPYDHDIPAIAAGWTIHAGSMRYRHVAIVNKGFRTCVFPNTRPARVKPQFTITTVTFTSPDGTEYDFRDRIYDGEPKGLVDCEPISRGNRFEAKDGTAATFVSDVDIRDSLETLENNDVNGFVYLRDGTRFRIEHGKAVQQRDNNGNVVRYEYDGNQLKKVTDNMGRTITVTYNTSQSILATITVKGIGGQDRVTVVRGRKLSNYLVTGQANLNVEQLFPVEAVTMSQGTTAFNPRVINEITLPDGHKWEFKYNSYGEVAYVKTPARGVVEFDMGPVNGIGNGGYDTIFNQIFRRALSRRTYPSDTGPIEGKVTYSDPTDPANIDSSTGNVTVEQTELDPSNNSILAKTKHKFSGHPKRGLNRGNQTEYRPWLEGKELETEQFNFDGSTVMRRNVTLYQQQAGVAWVPGANADTLSQPENNPRVIRSTNRLFDGAVPKVSRVEYEYDGFNNVTGEVVTGYDNEIIRQVDRTYVSTLNGIDYTGLNTQIDPNLDTHLRSLLASETIKDAQNNSETTSTYEYDKYNGTNNTALVPRTRQQKQQRIRTMMY
ncbi:MAG: hypothetical protein FD167_285 [bacterium]|nr:MAG: hypothetical protein FD167_285 [bacterium]